MSKAFRCDRCGKCFDPYAVSGDQEFATIFGYCYQNGELFDNNEAGYREIDDVHLCPECTSQFSIFMANATFAKTARDLMKKEEYKPRGGIP